MQILPDKTLEFLKLVASAALANPFSAERDQLDTQIAKMLPHKHALEMIPEAIAQETEKTLQSIIGNGKLQSLSAPQAVKEIISDAALFSIFHRYIAEFDKHIVLQNESPGKNLPLSCAPQIIADLTRILSPSEAAQLIGLFFQMRRAYFFISRHVGGGSQPIRQLRERLWRSLFTYDIRQYLRSMHSRMESFSILLLGETGVGKSQAASALGRSAFIPFDLKSMQFAASFLDIHLEANISEYPETLIESELFGHRKGSFTGALDNYAGLLGQTHPNGMLFLDEIGELSPPVQVKLLRVLQERVYAPVGSHEQRRFSGRLVSATNANIFQKINRNEFRADLFYRLASDVIQVPALRDRFQADPYELRALTERVLRRLTGEANTEQVVLLVDALKKIIPENYAWPGNLREFEQCIRSFLLHGTAAEISLFEGLQTLPNSVSATIPEAWAAVHWTADEMLAAYTQAAYKKWGSFEKVAQQLAMDWRTVKKWVNVQKM
jgi:transcriptional regulator with AAA-type ATPase domain